jgi:cell division protein FtsQ
MRSRGSAMITDLFLKRSLWWVLGGFFVIGLVLSVFFVFNKPIQQVFVFGYFNQLTPVCVNDVLAKQLHGRPWPSHQEKLFQSTQAHCPWLYRWQWSHRWPSILVIKIEENQPQLVFNQNSLMNQSEQLFSPEPMPEVLPSLHFEGSPDRFSDLLTFYKQASPLLQAQNFSIVDLKLDAAQAFEITLNNGILLIVSVQDGLLELSRFLLVDQNLFKNKHKPIQTIDLRYPHGFAVEWKTKAN